jgi:WD40 repeat protein
MFDIRQNDSLISLKAHNDSAVNCISISSKITNMFISASEDEQVKVWDINNGKFDLIHEKKLKIGPINSVKSNPDSGFIFAFGGAKSNNPVIWDSQEIKHIRDTFYPRMGMKEEDLTAIDENIKTEKISNRKQQRAANYKNFNRNKKFKK